MALIGPFNVGYPVAFRSGGDTTRVAFGKHIQEIERIYGILTALDADKISASDLDGKLGNFKPSLSFNDISGSLELSRTTGNLDASRVIGKLSNANIDASNVNGLSSLIGGLVPTPEDKGDGIVLCEPDSNGYIKFNNGLIIQWGEVNVDNIGSSDANEEKLRHASFPIVFSSSCLNLILTMRISPAADASDRRRDFMPMVKSMNVNEFSYVIKVPDNMNWDSLSVLFSAIGY